MTSERQFPRYAVGTEVTLRTRSGVIARGVTTNLSRGGLCANLDAEPTRGQSLEVSLALVFSPGALSEPLALPARVVWCTAIGDTCQAGLAFLPLSREQAGFLDMFLRFLAEGADADEPDEGSGARRLPFDLPSTKR